MSGNAANTAGSILYTAALAATATTAAAAVCGALEIGKAAAPVNAISHVVWGDEAARRDAVSAKYTGIGSAVNAAAMVSWAAFHHFVFRPAGREPGSGGALLRGAATAGIAYVVDYHVVPKRLTPGFEMRLSNWSLLAIYTALAVSLAVGDGRQQKP